MDNTDIKINIPQSQYVYVAKNLSGEGAIMLPIKSDGSLALKTVCVLFPDVIELEYKCTSTGLFRQLLMDPQKTFFYEPLDGWADKKFVAICKKEEPVHF